MKKILISFLLLSFFIMFRISSGHADNDWVEQTVPGDYIVTDIQFLNDDVGFYSATTCNGYWGKTTDGGNNWVEMDYWGSAPRFCLLFFNENHGIVAGDWFPPGKWNYTIAITYDGGNTFQWPNGPVPVIEELYFIDTLHGWSASYNEVGYTSDGGLNWISSYYCLHQYFYDICFSDSLHGWVVGRYGYPDSGLLLYSVDGGMSWDMDSVLSGNTPALYGISFPDSLNGWIVGDFGTILYTYNGGISWIEIPSGVVSTLRDVYFYNANIGWIAGDNGFLWYTTNGGNNWIDQNLNINNDLYNIFFLDSLKGWVGGDNTILHTECGGSSVEEEVSGLNLYDNQIEISLITATRSYQVSFQLITDSYIRIEIFNILGQKIKTLADGLKITGNYEIIWDGSGEDGSHISTGSYFLRFQAGDFISTKSFIVLK